MAEAARSGFRLAYDDGHNLGSASVLDRGPL